MAASINTEMEKTVLEPLLLPDPELSTTTESKENSLRERLPCLICLQIYDIHGGTEEYLKHLLVDHKLVIADVSLIANFKSYILYWKERFKEQPLTDFCSVIQTTETEDGEGYHLLSDVLPEDKQLREFLQKRNLENVLAVQQKEREDETFSRGCLFCRDHFAGNRSVLFNHMAQDHGFNVGQSDNLVYVNEFLDVLDHKLSSLQCLYCEKTFRDKTVLKEHMRKKQHRKINCKNNIYDKYYIINYLELGKNWEKLQYERDTPNMEDDDETESEDEWSGWEEEISGQAICLYCQFSSSNPDKLRLHMHELHDFDLRELKLRLNLNFYQQVKLVNFIRRQVHLCLCVGCQMKFDDRSSLLDHMHQYNHTTSIPDVSVWDQPQYFFPTYENDNLLCQLEDEDDSGLHGNENVIAEDTPTLDTILAEEHLRKEILSS